MRTCRAVDADEMLAIINAAAEAYRGVIPADCFHQPYMSAKELASEIADGVAFSGIEQGGRLLGVMGMQNRHNVALIRHAYVSPEWQGRGIGARLLHRLCQDARRPLLVGTWAAAEWVIRFYARNGFARVASEDIAPLLRAYWRVPDRQIATSVVLAFPASVKDTTLALIADAGK